MMLSDDDDADVANAVAATDDDDDDDDDDAIKTLRLRHFETFYRHFETRLPEWKCKKEWQINIETERLYTWLVWRPCDWLNVTEGCQVLLIISSSSDDN